MMLKESGEVVEMMGLNKEVKSIVFTKEETVLRFMSQFPVMKGTLSAAELEGTIGKIIIALL